jgi:hypothetical protein
MKQKLRDRLDRIEKALKELTKEVRALHPAYVQDPNGEDNHEEVGDPIPADKPKEGNKAVKAALGKTRKRSN